MRIKRMVKRRKIVFVRGVKYLVFVEKTANQCPKHMALYC
jgi:hypothetical protein